MDKNMSISAILKPNKPSKIINTGVKQTSTNISYCGEFVAKVCDVYNVGDEQMPISVIRSLAVLKKATALANEELKLLSKDKTVKIIKAIDEIVSGDLDAHFPLKVWQSGAGMCSNINVNEVIVNRALNIVGEKVRAKKTINNPIDPIEDVNKSHTSNDAFSIAIHIAAASTMKNDLIPAAKKLRNSLDAKSKEFANVIKVGRTHSMDAFLFTFGEELAGYVQLLDNEIERMEHSIDVLCELALGTMVIGDDRTTIPKEFPSKVAKQLQKITKLPVRVARNKLAVLSSKDALMFAHSTIRLFASTLLKIANDIRILASGPRCGIGELTLPQNIDEPIMTGHIPNEITAMVCAQVFGNDTTIQFAGTSGELELNVYMPVIIYNFLQSATLLTDTSIMFEKQCIKGIKINRTKNTQHTYNTLVTIRELEPQVGIENCKSIVKFAIKEDITIKDAATKLGFIKEDEFERKLISEKYFSKKK